MSENNSYSPDISLLNNDKSDNISDKSDNISDNNSDENLLDIDADTETMNNQITKHMDKTNKANQKIDNSKEAPKKIIKIDKDMLKTLIVEYLSLDDQIRSFKETIKDKTEEKKQYENLILELMGALKQDIILTDKGNLERNVRESKGPLTPELIKITLTEILKCSETANIYTEAIIDKRPIKELIALKRKNIGDTQKKTKPLMFQKERKNKNQNKTDFK
jgi:hypothetical protein